MALWLCFQDHKEKISAADTEREEKNESRIIKGK